MHTQPTAARINATRNGYVITRDRRSVIVWTTRGIHNPLTLPAYRDDVLHVAEYKADNESERRYLRRDIDQHLADGGTLGNYQW